MSSALSVRVPATTANLGPGFDSLGLALSLCNDATFRWEGLGGKRPRGGAPAVRVEVHGLGAGELPNDERNLVWRAASRVMAECGISARRVTITCRNRIALASGLGSSAAACVAGLVAANAAARRPLSRERLLEIATDIEGHPDNAAAALWGGLTACYDAGGRPRALAVPLRVRFKVVACVPEFRLPTSEARAALPRQIAHRDAVLAVGRVAALVGMLAGGDAAGMAAAMEDTLHQPYRAPLVPGMEQALRAAVKSGALGAALSGAGPTLVAFTPPDTSAAEKVGRALARAFRDRGISSRCEILRVDRRGARILRPPA